ncbi:hypothetical protein SLA2020_513350 [Shorea laevis]
MLCFAPIPLCIIVTTLSFLFLFCSPVAGSEFQELFVYRQMSMSMTVKACAQELQSRRRVRSAALKLTRVAKLGFCEVGSNGSASLPGQALLLVHIVWLILLGFSVLCGLF